MSYSLALTDGRRVRTPPEITAALKRLDTARKGVHPYSPLMRQDARAATYRDALLVTRWLDEQEARARPAPRPTGPVSRADRRARARSKRRKSGNR